MAWIRYRIEKHQVYSNGQWIDIEPLETRLSDPLGEYDTLEECYRGRIPQYKWVDDPELEPICDECYEPMYRWYQLPNDDYICDGQAPMYRFGPDSGTVCVGFDKYNRAVKQVSTDGGYTWTNVYPPEYTATTIAVKNSIDCGFIPEYGTHLTFEAIDSGKFGFKPTSVYASNRSVQYSLDSGSTWTTIYSGATTPTVSAGQKVMWKGNSFGYGLSFTSTGRFNVEGNVMSLKYGDSYSANTSIDTRCFNYLFYGCSGLTSAEKLYLPSATLAEECYYGMFQNCSGLTAAPVIPATTMARRSCYVMFAGCSSLTTLPENMLPATTLAEDCYWSMFSSCSSLTTTPELPATTLASGCYRNMFTTCTSLTTVHKLSATTLAYHCYNWMFKACTGLTSVPSDMLPATALVDSCYAEMFSGCTSLTTAPNLPATTLTRSCYYGMFRACSGLTSAPSLSATTLAQYCYGSMFNGCSSLTTAPNLPAKTLVEDCYSYMFAGCESLTTTPVMSATTLASGCCADMYTTCTSLRTAVLPATTLVNGCYNYMFYNCSNLDYIKCLATNPYTGYTENWVKGVSSGGRFVKDANTTWTSGNSGRPSNWVVQNA